MKRILLSIAGAACALNVSAQDATTTGAASLADYIYTAPQGWTATPYPDGVVINSPVSNTDEKCFIGLWPMRPSSGDLESDAGNVFREVFRDFEPRQGLTSASALRGVSAQGWEYFIAKRGMGARGDAQDLYGFLLVAGLGARVAAVSGVSKDPLVSSCFGLNLTDVWPRFFYSLRFKNWKPPSGSAALAQKVPGIWMAATATAGDRYAFAPNGRYAGASAAQRYVRISSMEVLRVTDAYFGDGAYAVKGHQITLTPDSKTRGAQTGYFRVEQESKDGGRTWAEKLYLLLTSRIDGREYEVVYSRQND
jgi:hypothetical protein